MKQCIDCQVELVVGENYTEMRLKRYEYRCNECWKPKNRENYMWNQWKLKERDYQAILKSQGGGCALCGKTEEEEGIRLAIDHVHDKEPLDIRGILCVNCNNALGNFFDNTQTLQNAIHYLNMDYHKIKRAA